MNPETRVFLLRILAIFLAGITLQIILEQYYCHGKWDADLWQCKNKEVDGH